MEAQGREQSRRIDDVRDAVTNLETRMDRRFDAVDRRFDALDGKMDRQFRWLVGMQVTMLLAIVATLATR